MVALKQIITDQRRAKAPKEMVIKQIGAERPGKIKMEILIAVKRLRIIELEVKKSCIKISRPKRLGEIAKSKQEPGAKQPRSKKAREVKKWAYFYLSTASWLLLVFWRLVSTAKCFWCIFFFFIF